MFEEKYIPSKQVSIKTVIKIIITVLIIFGVGFGGFWLGGGFVKTTKTDEETNIDNYIDANLERLKSELDCVIDENKANLETIRDLVDYINDETDDLNDRLESLQKHKEFLNETEKIVDRINDNIDRFKPKDR